MAKSQPKGKVVSQPEPPAPVVRPIIHTLCYGESGAGKSTFAATFPKPMIVFMFDPYGKDMPYFKGLNAQWVESDEQGTPIQQGLDVGGNLLVQVEYYHDAEPHQPESWQRFLNRMYKFSQEYESWATVVVDSVTFMEITARKQQQYRLNPTAKDHRQWYGGSKEQVEEMLMIRFSSMPINVCVNAHVDEDKDELHGSMVRNPSAPGKLRKNLASAFGELYHIYVARDEKGNKTHQLQTESDQFFRASTQIQAPDPSWPEYEALWEGGR